jgi:hypothetical protein
MKKIILLATLLTLIGCDGLSQAKCQESVERKYPDALEIRNISGSKYRFIVLTKDSIVRSVNTMDFDDEISSDIKLFDLGRPY